MARARPGGGLAWRGIWHRRELSLGLFVVAVLAAASAAIGPAYFEAAATSTVRATFADAQAMPGATVMAFTNGVYEPEELESRVHQVFGDRAHLFDPAFPEWLLSGRVPGSALPFELLWRDNVCDHLRLLDGRCPSAPGEVIVSSHVADATGWTIGSTFDLTGRSTTQVATTLRLTVAGVYRPIDLAEPFWFGRNYFPLSGGHDIVDPELQRHDALFTSQETFAAAELRPLEAIDRELEVRAMLPLAVDRLTRSDIEPLAERFRWLDTMDVQQGVRVSSEVPRTLVEAGRATASMGVPFLLVSIQLVVLCWLLLFLITTDLAAARGGEVALAKLRGLPAYRLLGFLLAEPLVLLTVALPVGVLTGGLGARALTTAALGPDIPAEVTAASWLAAGVAIAGGFVAAAAASRRTLMRSVTEEWRRVAHRPERMPWLFDAALITLAVLGLIQLTGAGPLQVASQQQTLTLLTPAVVALAVAVVAARVLPLACRAFFGVTRRRGTIGLFLALRQMARRPGGARSAMALTVSFTLLLFAVAAWNIGRDTYRTLAASQLGAQVVLTVKPPPDDSVAEIMQQLDPQGERGTLVLVNPARYPGDSATLGVEPQQFDRFANWRTSAALRPLPELLPRLHVPVPPRVFINGDQLRLTLNVRQLEQLANESGEPASLPQVAVQLAAPDQPDGIVRRLGAITGPGLHSWTARLTACYPNCELRKIFLMPGAVEGPLTAVMVVEELAERGPGGWQPVAAGLDSPARWQAWARGDLANEISVAHDPAGLAMGFIGLDITSEPGIRPITHPEQIPIIAAGPVASGDASVRGLDGKELPTEQVAIAADLPLAMGNGALMEADLLRRASLGISDRIERQIWTSYAAAPSLRDDLRSAGVRVLEEQDVGQLATDLERRGVGLALGLLITEAAVAALLAAGGLILAMYAFGRRRAYELAALVAAGAGRRTLRRGIFLEQALLLGFAMLTGSATGVVVARVASPALPWFGDESPELALGYTPDAVPILAVVGLTLAALLIAAGVTARALMRKVGAAQLREAGS